MTRSVEVEGRRAERNRLLWAGGICVYVLSVLASSAELLKELPDEIVIGGAALLLVALLLLAPKLRHRGGDRARRHGVEDDEPPPRQPLRMWLPNPDGDLVGRDALVEDTAARLEREHLVTLLGAGGSGKTRVALAVGERMKARFDGRVSFIDLLLVTRGAPVTGAVARQLDVPLVPRVGDVATLKNALSGDETLLIFDNCEHVAEQAAALIGELLRDCPGLRVLATSRHALGVIRESRVEVHPLAVPAAEADLATAGRSPSVQLFVERARRAAGGFELTEATLAAVTRICRKVDGLPYALVLIAARLGEEHVNDVLRDLDESLLTLEAGPDQPRHRATLAATIAWSVRLLDSEERVLFRRVAVFTGSFTREGASRVHPEIPADRVAPALVALCRASLIHLVADSETTRYRLLEVARAWGREALEEASGERPQAEHAHAQHMLDVTRRLDQRLKSRERLEALAELDAEYDDIAAALAWSLEHETDLVRRLVGGLRWYWGFRGLLKEGERWVQAALAAPAGTDALARAEVLLTAGNLAFIRGDFDVAVERLTASVAAAEAIAARGGEAADRARSVRAYALTIVGMSESSRGRYDVALEAVHASRQAFEGIGDAWGFALATNDAGTVARYAGSGTAKALYEESLAAWEQIEDPWGLSLTLSNLATVAIAEGRPADANDFIARALPLLGENAAGMAGAQLKLAEIARLTGDPVSADAHYRESLRQNRAMDRRTSVAECLDRLSLLYASSGQRTDAAFLCGVADAYRDANGMQVTGAAFPTGPAERDAERRRAIGSIDDEPELAASYAQGRGTSVPAALRQVAIAADG